MECVAMWKRFKKWAQHQQYKAILDDIDSVLSWGTVLPHRSVNAGIVVAAVVVVVWSAQVIQWI